MDKPCGWTQPPRWFGLDVQTRYGVFESVSRLSRGHHEQAAIPIYRRHQNLTTWSSPCLVAMGRPNFSQNRRQFRASSFIRCDHVTAPSYVFDR